MRYLLEVEWKDPVATAVARVLSGLPGDVEQTTGSVPPGVTRGFVVLSSSDRAALDGVARAVAAAGAGVRIVVGEASSASSKE